MAILGIAIQSNTGIPLFIQTWSEKLTAFREGNPILIAGFLSALNSFANNYRQEIGYIHFIPKDYPNDPYGIEGMYSFIGEFMFLVFTDPYQFQEGIHTKMRWIYSKVLFRYEHLIRVGRVPVIKEEEDQFIKGILMDEVAARYVYTKKEQLNVAINYIMQEEFPGDVLGCFITSFDNSILFQQGMGSEEIETYLNKIGSKSGGIQEGEVLHHYVALPGLEPRLVVMTNPGVKIEISDILGEVAGEGSVPLYYYLITDANSAIGPIVESLMVKFNAVLI